MPRNERDPPPPDGGRVSEEVLPGKLNTSDCTETGRLVEDVDDWRRRVQQAADAFLARRQPARRPYRGGQR